MQRSAPLSKSHLGRNVTILAVVVIVFFLVPVVPYTFASASFFGIASQATGDVSLSYSAFHCGVVVNVQESASFLGQSASRATSNPGWVCNQSSK